eukprot:TRINITY_DN467_c4_g1_i1.p1 TRINITY_DN467_c4_g1~~TRINITY_DN467_c4_g1_i1.p1  ORF type:complete len:1239 (+),score=290.79 TRINITY_DN467_c4_g1_i1:29-3745(+)
MSAHARINSQLAERRLSPAIAAWQRRHHAASQSQHARARSWAGGVSRGCRAQGIPRKSPSRRLSAMFGDVDGFQSSIPSDPSSAGEDGSRPIGKVQTVRAQMHAVTEQVAGLREAVQHGMARLEVHNAATLQELTGLRRRIERVRERHAKAVAKRSHSRDRVHALVGRLLQLEGSLCGEQAFCIEVLGKALAAIDDRPASSASSASSGERQGCCESDYVERAVAEAVDTLMAKVQNGMRSAATSCTPLRDEVLPVGSSKVLTSRCFRTAAAAASKGRLSSQHRPVQMVTGLDCESRCTSTPAICDELSTVDDAEEKADGVYELQTYADAPAKSPGEDQNEAAQAASEAERNQSPIEAAAAAAKPSQAGQIVWTKKKRVAGHLMSPAAELSASTITFNASFSSTDHGVAAQKPSTEATKQLLPDSNIAGSSCQLPREMLAGSGNANGASPGLPLPVDSRVAEPGQLIRRHSGASNSSQACRSGRTSTSAQQQLQQQQQQQLSLLPCDGEKDVTFTGELTTWQMANDGRSSDRSACKQRQAQVHVHDHSETEDLSSQGAATVWPLGQKGDAREIRSPERGALQAQAACSRPPPSSTDQATRSGPQQQQQQPQQQEHQQRVLAMSPVGYQKSQQAMDCSLQQRAAEGRVPYILGGSERVGSAFSEPPLLLSPSVSSIEMAASERILKSAAASSEEWKSLSSSGQQQYWGSPCQWTLNLFEAAATTPSLHCSEVGSGYWAREEFSTELADRLFAAYREGNDFRSRRTQPPALDKRTPARERSAVVQSASSNACKAAAARRNRWSRRRVDDSAPVDTSANGDDRGLLQEGAACERNRGDHKDDDCVVASAATSHDNESTDSFAATGEVNDCPGKAIDDEAHSESALTQAVTSTLVATSVKSVLEELSQSLGHCAGKTEEGKIPAAEQATGNSTDCVPGTPETEPASTECQVDGPIYQYTGSVSSDGSSSSSYSSPRRGELKKATQPEQTQAGLEERSTMSCFSPVVEAASSQAGDVSMRSSRQCEGEAEVETAAERQTQQKLGLSGLSSSSSECADGSGTSSPRGGVWQAVWSDSHGLYYYWNTATDEVRWHLPEEGEEAEAVAKAKEAASFDEAEEAKQQDVDATEPETASADDEAAPQKVVLSRATLQDSFGFKLGTFQDGSKAIVSVARGSPAGGQLQVDDKVVAINGTDMVDVSHAAACALVKQAVELQLLVLRGGAAAGGPTGSAVAPDKSPSSADTG